MNMREKIARAIAAQKMGLSNNGECLPDDVWMQAIPSAAAVLDAMREPTQGMIDAHYAAHAKAETVFASAEDVWHAMIDAAKEETK